MKESPAFRECLSLATYHISFSESKTWTKAMRIAALELFKEAEERAKEQN